MEVASREAIGRGRASHGRAYALLALFVVGTALQAGIPFSLYRLKPEV